MSHDDTQQPNDKKRFARDRAECAPARKPVAPATPEAGRVGRPASTTFPGSATWLAEHGINPKVWAERGVSRYTTNDSELVKDAYRGFLRKTRLGTVTKAVHQSGGLVMPKHAPPGFAPIPPQLRPDKAIVLDSSPTWHCHGVEGGDWPVFPDEAGKAAGKFLPRVLVLRDLTREQHINKAKSAKPYDPVTGIGDHYGVNVEGVHYHAPSSAKYILLGEKRANLRIDMHPWALEMLPKARRVFFVLEGTLKNDAVLSAGECVFSVPSVTLWDYRELSLIAKRYLQDKTVFIIPDADWYTNLAVDRQALLVRSCIRRQGVDARIAAPPITGLANGVKGVDDFLGFGGGTIEELVVRGREVPLDRIVDFTFKARHRLNRYRRARFALEGLSLHADPDGELPLPMGTLARIMDTRKRNVVDVLEDLADAIEVHGSMEVTIKQWRDGQTMEWTERPTIRVRPEFRAKDFKDEVLGDCWKEKAVTRAEFEFERGFTRGALWANMVAHVKADQDGQKDAGGTAPGLRPGLRLVEPEDDAEAA